MIDCVDFNGKINIIY